jgi:hypothetical protein
LNVLDAPAQTDPELMLRLQATIFLEESGWSTAVIPQHHGGVDWDVFFAYRDGYSDQRAVSVQELLRRCLWEERYREDAHKLTKV